MSSSEIVKKTNNNNIQSQRAFMELIQDTNEIMSCEGKTLIQLMPILRRLLLKNPDQNWILEIDVLANMFEIRKLKLNTNYQTINEFEGFWRCKIGLLHTILKIIPVKQ
jgi:predicted transcriptional regulator